MPTACPLSRSPSSFNTTTSMGRLTLNVLLSFAQFEREVTSERIRDKIAASKRKGLWVGGPLPLGYEMKDGKVTVVESEAEQVRLIYRRYLELSGVNALVRDLKELDIRTKKRLLATGGGRGGIPFERGSLFYLLRNLFYVGEVRYKGDILPGEQPPIMERALFDAVQQKLTDQWTAKTSVRNPNNHLLDGLLFDDACYPMAPTHATKSGIRYRYYVSRPCLHGETKTAKVGSITRVPATDIEDVVVKSLNGHLRGQSGVPALAITSRTAIAEVIDRIGVYGDRLEVRLRSRESPGTTNLGDDIAPTDDAVLFHSLAEAAVQKIPANPVAPRRLAKRGPAGATGTTPPPRQRHRARQTLAGRDYFRIRHRRSANCIARAMQRP